MLGVVLLPLFAACLAGPAWAADTEVIAKIGPDEVKTGEIRSQLEKLDPIQQVALSREPAQLSQAVRQLLLRKMVLKEAKAANWQSQPEVAEQLERLREQAIVESYLLSVSAPPKEYPSEVELKAAYEANQNALVVPKQYHLAQIFIAAPKDADKETLDKAKTKLDEVLAALKNRSADFAELARAHSQEPASAGRDGEVGWLTEAQIQPAIREKVAGMQKNSVSDAIEMEDGWHVVKVLDLKEQRTAGFEEVREQLASRMRQEKQRANSVEYINQLLKNNPVAINELELNKLLPGVRTPAE